MVAQRCLPEDDDDNLVRLSESLSRQRFLFTLEIYVRTLRDYQGKEPSRTSTEGPHSELLTLFILFIKFVDNVKFY